MDVTKIARSIVLHTHVSHMHAANAVCNAMRRLGVTDPTLDCVLFYALVQCDTIFRARSIVKPTVQMPSGK